MGVLGLSDVARQKDRVARRRRIGVKRLNRVDDDTGDLMFQSANGVKGRRMEILQRETVTNVPFTAEAGLHAVPPAVIRPGKTHDQFATSVESGEPDRSHDGFGTAHVKGDFVQFGDGLELCDVVGDDRVQGPQHGPQIFHALPALLHPFLIAIIARDIDTVGAGNIQRPMSVDVKQLRSFGCGDDGAEIEFLLHQAGERKGHPSGISKPQIRESAADLMAPHTGLRIAFLKIFGQTIQRALTLRCRIVVGAVGFKKCLGAVGVGFDPCGEHAREDRGERSGSQRLQCAHESHAHWDGEVGDQKKTDRCCNVVSLKSTVL